MEVLEKILVIQTAFLGDAVLTLPMIQKLKEQKPLSRISVLCIPSNFEVFANSKDVDEVITYDKRGSQKSFISYLKLVLQIRSSKFNLVISPHRSIRSTFISFFSGSTNTVGFNISDASFLYKKRVKYFKTKHEVERNLSLINYDVSNQSWRVLPEMIIKEEVKIKVAALLRKTAFKKFITIAPGSVWKTKVYPKEYFEILISLITKNEYGVVLIGGKEDVVLCESIVSNCSNTISFAGMLTIPESVELLKNCSALVCNDSAPTHLAMIAGISTLTVYCSTIPEFGFYPYNETSKYVSCDDLECKPCGIHGHNECPIKTFACAYHLKPNYVYEKLKEIIPA